MEYLDVEDLLALTERLGVGPVSDVGMLHAACARPQATLLGDDAYRTPVDKAAALLHSLVRNHALVDGNKRLGWLATVVFLDLNHMVVDMADDDAFTMVMGVADGTWGLADIVEPLQPAVKAVMD